MANIEFDNFSIGVPEKSRIATSEPPKLSSPRKRLATLSDNIEGLSTARGKHKLGMLCKLARGKNIAILTLTESHLNENFHDVEVNIDGLSNYRADRTTGIRKVVVIVYVRNDLLSGLSNIISGSIGNIETWYFRFHVPKFYVCQSTDFLLLN